jgi:uncharacterized membrane protein
MAKIRKRFMGFILLSFGSFKSVKWKIKPTWQNSYICSTTTIMNHIRTDDTAEKHPKQEFQMERIAFFSDAVFAIAITLLILEIKVPQIASDSTYDKILQQFLDLKYGFISLLISFLLISSYWIMHHVLFKHIHNYNRPLIWANMVFLLTIIFFPFTTSLFAESSNNISIVSIALKLFLVKNILALIALNSLYWLVFKKYKELTFKLSYSEEMEVVSDLIFPLVLYFILLITTFFTGNLNVLLVIITVSAIIRRLFIGINKRKGKVLK